MSGAVSTLRSLIALTGTLVPALILTVVLVTLAVFAALLDTPHDSTANGAVRLGVWFPYISNSGVPPLSSFQARGIDASFIAGDIDADVLASYDVIFFGRTGMEHAPE